MSESTANTLALQSRDELIGLLDSLRLVKHDEQTNVIRRHFEERLRSVPENLRKEYTLELMRVMPCFPDEPAQQEAPVNVELSAEELTGKLLELFKSGKLTKEQRLQIGVSLRDGGFSTEQEPLLPASLCACLGLPKGTRINSDRVHLLLERFSKAIESIVRATLNAWWKLPPDADPGPLAPFRIRLEAAMKLGDAEFNRALDELLEPLGLAKALVAATRDAADVFAEHHHRKFIAKEIRNMVRIDGYASEKAMWQRFEKISESWNQQAFRDWFRRAVMESALNNLDCQAYLDELKQKGFKDRPWPWAAS